MAAAVSHPPPADPEVRTLLRHVTWEAYVALADDDPERNVPRICYLDGVLELMSPSLAHERIAATLGRLVQDHCIDRGIRLDAFRSTTLRRPGERKGAEPDDAYLVGSSGDLPNLVIEAVITHSDLDKLALYAGLGIAEYWVISRESLLVYILRDGRYYPASRSHLLPDLNLRLAHTCSCLDVLSEAVATFRRGG